MATEILRDMDVAIVHVPMKLLGLSYSTWTMADIRVILDYYRTLYHPQATKHDLMLALGGLCSKRGLVIKDRDSILGAHRDGRPLPRLKPIVRSPPSRPSHRFDFNRDRQTVDNQRGENDAWRVAGKREHQDNHDRPTSHRSRERTKLANTKNRQSPIPSMTVGDQTILATTNSGSGGLRAIKCLKSSRPVGSDASCAICFERFDARSFPSRSTTANCNHEVNVCSACLSLRISAQFESKVWNRIECPICEERLESRDVKDFGDEEIFNRFFEEQLIETQYPANCLIGMTSWPRNLLS